MGSHLYRGRIQHSRLMPFRHSFRYRVFYGLFDIDELAQLDHDLRLFSLGRFNLFSFDPTTHGPGDGSSLRNWADSLLNRAGVDLEGGSIQLLAFPRILGYVFDPISVWYCYGPNGDLRAVMHEVRNTFGDRHTYVVPIVGQARSHSFTKGLHVSPFNGMDYDYNFTIGEPGMRLTLTIEQTDANGAMFRAGMALARLEFTDRNLARLFITHPLLTLKVISAIHWEALKIKLKGGKYHQRPEAPRRQVSYIEPDWVKS